MVADSIYQRFGEAQARLDLMNQVEDLELVAELEQAEVEDQLAARRRRLGLEPELEDVKEPPTPTSSEPPPPETPTPEPTPDEPGDPPGSP